jgi:hypothetical protein
MSRQKVVAVEAVEGDQVVEDQVQEEANFI